MAPRATNETAAVRMFRSQAYKWFLVRLLLVLLVVEVIVVGGVYYAARGSGEELKWAILVGSAVFFFGMFFGARFAPADPVPYRAGATRAIRRFRERGSDYPGYGHTDSSAEDSQRERDFQRRLEEMERTEEDIVRAFADPPDTEEEEDRFIGNIVWAVLPLITIILLVLLLV